MLRASVPAGGRIAAGIALGLLLALVLGLLPRGLALRWTDPHGFLEDVSLVLYGAAAFLLFLAAKRRRAIAFAECAALVALVALAEVDPGRAVSTLVEHPGVWLTETEGRVPPLFAAILIALGLGVVLHLAVTQGRRFLRALRDRRASAWLALTALVALIGAETLERAQRAFTWQEGYRAYKGTLFALSVGEECLELLVPFFLLLAAWDLHGAWYHHAPQPHAGAGARPPETSSEPS
jgi:hypothetical protein